MRIVAEQKVLLKHAMDNDQTQPTVNNFVSYTHMVPIYNQNVISTTPDTSSLSHPTPPVKNVVSVARRNARERRRIKHVNSAFDDLRKRVPTGNDYRKISKVETLRSAIEYIKALEAIVERQKTDLSSSHVTSSTNQDVPAEERQISQPWQPAVTGENFPMYSGCRDFTTQVDNKMTKDSFPGQDVGERFHTTSHISNPDTPLPVSYEHESYLSYHQHTTNNSFIYS